MNVTERSIRIARHRVLGIEGICIAEVVFSSVLYEYVGMNKPANSPIIRAVEDELTCEMTTHQ